MHVVYRMRSNGTDAEVVALDCGPGPHHVEMRSLPSGGFLGRNPTEWAGMGDRLLHSFVNDPIPESIRVRAYGQVEADLDLDGPGADLTPPEHIDAADDPPANFTQVEDRPIVDPLRAPCDDYDDLTVEDIKERLGDVDDESLADWRAYEEQNKNRKGVLSAIDARGEAQALGDPPQPGDDDGATTVIEES